MNNELIERMNKVSARSLDGNVVMDSKEWNAIVELVSAALSQDRMPTNISGFGVVTVGDSFDGYDDDENGGDIHTAGINVGKWGNRIEIYGKGKDAAAEAEVLRDIILAALSEPVASVPQDVEEFIAEKQRHNSSLNHNAIHTDDLRAWMADHAKVKDVAAKEWNQQEGRDGKLYTDGWNACREAMLTASKESE